VLKRDITYEDFNGERVTDTFYFNLTRTEIIELELSYDGGLEASINKIIKAENVNALIMEFKKIVLLAYGQRTEDGKRFIKNDQLKEEFSQTAAYDALFMELATDDDAAATFIKGIMPSDIVKEMAKTKTETVHLPPLPPPQS
jgi:hypothetical protein